MVRSRALTCKALPHSHALSHGVDVRAVRALVGVVERVLAAPQARRLGAAALLHANKTLHIHDVLRGRSDASAPVLLLDDPVGALEEAEMAAPQTERAAV